MGTLTSGHAFDAYPYHPAPESGARDAGVITSPVT